MKKTLSLIIIIALVCVLAFTFAACEEESDEVGIERFEIEDLELTEGDKFNEEDVVITAYKTDGETAEVKNNLDFDLTALEEFLDEENTLSDDSAGEYKIPVYHLEKHIGDLKVIVNVKR